MFKVGILATHPIQYYAPWYRALAKQGEIDLQVYYAHCQDAQGQASAGFGVAFEWDIPLLDGYASEFLKNISPAPDVSSFSGCDTPEIAQRIETGAFDAFIVHGWNNRSFWQAMIACRRAGVPLLVRGDSQLETARPWMTRAIKQVLYRAFIPRFDGYLVVGERSRAYYRYYGARAEKMFRVPHAVDNDFFGRRQRELSRDRPALRARWSIPEDATVLLFAGKLLPRKRPLDFIEAIGRARTKVPSIQGLIVGDGPLRASLEEIVRRDALPIHFAGFLNQGEISKAYTAADALVLPSDASETWGLVVNEAMASGLPAIVSRSAGCVPDLIQAGETGESYDCGNIAQLTACVTTLAEGNRWHEMGLLAHQRIARYSIGQAVNGTVDAVRATAKRR